MLETLKNSSPETLAHIAEEKKIRRTDELFLLFALGSQFDHLIKQALERLGFFCLVADPSKVTATDVHAVNPKGIILSGGPASVHAEPPRFDNTIFDLGVPLLGICLGFQMWAKYIGVHVITSDRREFGRHLAVLVEQEEESPLFSGLPSHLTVLQSHGDSMDYSELVKVRYTTDSPMGTGRLIAAADDIQRGLYGSSFIPK